MRVARAKGLVRATTNASGSLERFVPGVMDQTSYGCCEGASSSGAIYTRFEAKGQPLGWLPSVHLLYNPARALDRAAATASDAELPPLGDVGTETNTIIRTIAEFGIQRMGVAIGNTLIDVTDANLNEELDLLDLEKGATSLIVGPYQIQSTGAQKLQDIKDSISSGIPVRVDSFVDMEFEEWTPNKAPIGAPNYADPEGGGHALYAYAYSGDILVVRNSWGAGWGRGGDILVSPAWTAQCDAFIFEVQRVQDAQKAAA
jgi:hypothetical protein